MSAWGSLEVTGGGEGGGGVCPPTWRGGGGIGVLSQNFLRTSVMWCILRLDYFSQVGLGRGGSRNFWKGGAHTTSIQWQKKRSLKWGVWGLSPRKKLNFDCQIRVFLAVGNKIVSWNFFSPKNPTISVVICIGREPTISVGIVAYRADTPKAQLFEIRIRGFVMDWVIEA